MTDGHGQSIRGIKTPVGVFDVEQTLHHKGHLFLFGAARTHQGFFHQGRFIVAYDKTVGGAGRHSHTARLPKLEGRGGVLGGKNLFDGGFDDIGRMLEALAPLPPR